MTQEQLQRIISNHELIKGFTDCWIRMNRIKTNRMMYDVFTPRYLKLWHKLLGKKPYMNFNYKPKF